MQAGATLGPYTILAPLGAGGMGEVFRARDERLHREVAVKILPAAVAKDPVRLRRFETEARAAGQLNHPSLLAVHDFGVAGGVPYLVTELLEGETLRARLTSAAGAASGVALPPRKAVEIAQQVARGLAAAHAKGIVHRDLKPENIFLTRDGHAKILDFGLAKMAAVVSEEAPTVGATGLTSAGQVLGTAGYMAPEQVRGLPADARTDLFALGAVLYEMLAGKRAFQRDTAAETMTAVLKEEPPAISPASGMLDPALQRVVDHCLEKDPAARFQTARDLEFALAALATGSSATRAADLPALTTPRSAHWRAFAAALFGLVVGGAAAHFLARPTPPQPWHFTAVTSYAGVQAQPALSPDGRSVAFTSDQDGHFNIYVALLGGGTPVEITHDANLKIHPTWSPDGANIAYARLDDGMEWDIWEVPALGGTPRRVILQGAEPSFARNGDLIYEHEGAIWEANGAGENARRLVGVASGFRYDLDPRLSPDGRSVAFTSSLATGGPYGDLAVADLASGAVRLLTHTGLANSPVWSPDSRSIYFSYNRAGAMNLWRIAVTGNDLRQITSGPGDDADLDISQDGQRIIFDTGHVDLALAEADLTSAPAPARTTVLNVDPARWLWAPRFSPDGKHLSFFTALKGVASESIGVANPDGSGAVLLLQDGAEDVLPRWTPDSARLDYAEFSTQPPEIRSVAIAGGSPVTLYRGPMSLPVPGRDGRVLVNQGPQLLALDPRTGRTQSLGRLPVGDLNTALWSADQKQIAYIRLPVREDDPAAGLWVTDLRDPPRQLLRGDLLTNLAAAGGALYVLERKPDLTTVLWKINWDGSGRTRLSSPVPALWDLDYSDLAIGNYFDVSPDGRRLVFQVEPAHAENIGLLTRPSAAAPQ